MELVAPHLLPPQARHIMEQPPRAAVVTTAIARALARVEDMEFMVMLLNVTKLRMAYCFTAAQPPLLAPHLALQAPHLAFIFLALWGLLAAHCGMAAPHLALQAPHLAMLDLGPHLVPAQPAAKAPPERAAAVTTAEARVFAILEESWFMEKSLESETGNMCGKAQKVK